VAAARVTAHRVQAASASSIAFSRRGSSAAMSGAKRATSWPAPSAAGRAEVSASWSGAVRALDGDRGDAVLAKAVRVRVRVAGGHPREQR
jgi:hypothetical protein